MRVDERDRRSLFDRLVEAIGEEAASTLMSLLPESDVATRVDLVELRSHLDRRLDRLDGDMANVDTSLRSELESLDSSLRGEFAKLDTSLRGDIAKLDTSLRSELESLDSSLRGELAKLDTSLSGELAKLDTSLSGDMADLETSFKDDIHDAIRSHARSIYLSHLATALTVGGLVLAATQLS